MYTGRYGAIVEERNRYVASHEAAHAADERAIVYVMSCHVIVETE